MNGTTTWEQVQADYCGGSGNDWLLASIEADKAGRIDLVVLCREEAAKAYAEEDEE